MQNKRFLTFLLLGAGFMASSAYAEPLPLDEIHRFNGWVQCLERCPAGGSDPSYVGERNHFECVARCNSTDASLREDGFGWGPAKRQWEKNGAYPTDRADLMLALYEFYNQRSGQNQGQLTCERGGDAQEDGSTEGEVVILGPYCGQNETCGHWLDACTEPAEVGGNAQCEIDVSGGLDTFDIANLCTNSLLGATCEGGVAQGDGWQLANTPGQSGVLTQSRSLSFTPANANTLLEDGTYKVAIEAYGTRDGIIDPITMTLSMGDTSQEFLVQVAPLTPRWDVYEATFDLTGLDTAIPVLTISSPLLEFQNLYVRSVRIEGPVVERLDCQAQSGDTVCWLPPDSSQGVDYLASAVRSPLCPESLCDYWEAQTGGSQPFTVAQIQSACVDQDGDGLPRWLDEADACDPSTQPCLSRTDLLSHWSFDEDSMTDNTVRDLVGDTASGDHPGLLKGWSGAAAPTISHEGVVGDALAFTNDGAYMAVDASALDGDGAFTVTSWFKSGPAEEDAVLIQQRMCHTRANSGVCTDATGYDGSYQLMLTAEGTVKGTATHKIGSLIRTWQVETANGTDLRDGQWHHVAMVQSATNATLFIDGRDPSTVTFQSPANLQGALSTYLGGDMRDLNKYFHGSLDEVTVWGRALASIEIETMYHRGTMGNTSVPTDDERDGVVTADRFCGGEGDDPCAFHQVCTYSDITGRSICEARQDCGDAPCTAFHLEKIAEDDQQVLVWVHFDHAAAPTRVLDLYIEYQRDLLTLEDSRRLPALATTDRALATTHLSDGTLRLSIYNTTSTEPIPYGPLVELVFRRTGDDRYCVMPDDHDYVLGCDPDTVPGCTGASNCEAQGTCTVKVCDCHLPTQTGLFCYDRACTTTDLENGLLASAEDFVDVGTNPDALNRYPACRITNENSIRFRTDDQFQTEAMAPEQGNDELSEDALWGNGVSVTNIGDADVKLMLLYDFDDAMSPLVRNEAPTAEEICERLPECALESDEATKNRILGQLRRLQHGKNILSPTLMPPILNGELPGLGDGAGYFNGQRDHLRMPVTFQEPLRADEQSFSFSAWFFAGGHLATDAPDSPHVIFAHNGQSDERTRYGLMVRKDRHFAEAMELSFFSGDLRGSDVVETTIRRNIAENTWHHVSMVMDAAENKVHLYVDGELEELIQLEDTSLPVSCPQFFREVDVHLKEQGALSIGGKPPQWLYRSVYKSGSYEVRRMDVETYNEEIILSDGATSYRYPDYNPVIDRLVFVSNATGNEEVWIADGDGNNKQQLTEGFGNSAYNMRARRPKMAPDGSAVVFESNASDVLAMDNRFQTYHLYYIGYDNKANVPEIQMPSGGTTTQLNYPDLVANQITRFFRLTDQNMNRNNTEAQWIKGNHRELVCMTPMGTGCSEGSAGCHCRDGEKRLGDLYYNSSSDLWDDYRIIQLSIGTDVLMKHRNAIAGLADYNEETKLLDVYRKVLLSGDSGITLKDRERLFYETSREVFETWPDDERHFAVEGGSCAWLSRDDGVPDNEDETDDDQDGVDDNVDNCPRTYNPNQDNSDGDAIGDACAYARCGLAVTFRPQDALFTAQCWDTNANGIDDQAEDLNEDLVHDVQDCYTVDVSNMFISFPLAKYSPNTLRSDVQAENIGSECVGPPQAGQERCRLADGKDLMAPKILYGVDINKQAVSMVQVEVKSPRDRTPLTNGWSVIIPFNMEMGETLDLADFELKRKRVDRHHYLRQKVSENILVNSQENIVFTPPQTDTYSQLLGGFPSANIVQDLRREGSSTTGAELRTSIGGFSCTQFGSDCQREVGMDGAICHDEDADGNPSDQPVCAWQCSEDGVGTTCTSLHPLDLNGVPKGDVNRWVCTTTNEEKGLTRTCIDGHAGDSPGMAMDNPQDDAPGWTCTNSDAQGRVCLRDQPFAQNLGVAINADASNLIGKTMVKASVWLRRVGRPSGSVSLYLQNSNGDMVGTVTSQPIVAASIPTAFTRFDFVTNHALQANDRILLKADGGDYLNYIQAEIAAANAYGEQALSLQSFQYAFVRDGLVEQDLSAQTSHVKVAIDVLKPACSEGLCSAQLQPLVQEGGDIQISVTPLGPSDASVSTAWRWGVTPFDYSEDGRVLTGNHELGINRLLDFADFPRGSGVYTLFLVAVDSSGAAVGAELSGQLTLTRRAVAGGPSSTSKKLEVLPNGFFEQLTEAVFSPESDRLLFNAYASARPVLLLSQGLNDALEVIDPDDDTIATLPLQPDRLSIVPERTRGMSWRFTTNYYPCNWVGGVLDPLTHQMIYGFQGGLDDVKMYQGKRSEMSIRSEVERGLEHLRADGLIGGPCGECEAGLVCNTHLGECIMESQLPTDVPCANSVDCPAYHVCEITGSGPGVCKVQGCQTDMDCPTNTHCVMTPATVAQQSEQRELDYVCAADCAGADSQCFTQECLNGPCRFCEQRTGECIECREEERDYGGYIVRGLEGCPDSKSFACESGACVTECYAFDDGTSVYLCDPLVEYCDRGFCRLLDWDWWDLAPSSFGGLGEARYSELVPDQRWPGYTMAVGENYPVEIEAWGIEDLGYPPEMLVEIKGSTWATVSGGEEWLTLGRVLVNNKTVKQAQENPVIFDSPYPFDEMRIRMVSSAGENGDTYHNPVTRQNPPEEGIEIRNSVTATKHLRGNKVKVWNKTAAIANITPFEMVHVSTSQMLVYTDTANSRLKSYSLEDEQEYTGLVNEGVLNSPKGIAANAGGDTVFVVDSGNNRLMVYRKTAGTWDNEGTFENDIYTHVTSGGVAFSSPTDVVFKEPFLYLSDTGNDQIHLYQWVDTELVYVASMTGLSQPTWMAVDDRTYLYVAQAGTNAVTVHDSLPSMAGTFQQHHSLTTYSYRGSTGTPSTGNLDNVNGLSVLGNATQRRLFVSQGQRVIALSVEKNFEQLELIDGLNVVGAGGGDRLVDPKAILLKRSLTNSAVPQIWVTNANGVFTYDLEEDPSLATSSFYPLGIPSRESTKACNALGLPESACFGNYDNVDDAKFPGGYPVLKIANIRVSGGRLVPNTNTWENYVCAMGDTDMNPDFGENGASPLAEHFFETAGYTMLNCAYDRRVDNPDELARIHITGIEGTLPLLNGPVSKGQIVMDTGDLCVVELDAQRVMPCYEWVGGSVSLDPYNSPVQTLQLLDVGLFQSFGHPDGFEAVPLPKFKLNLDWSGGNSLDTGWAVRLDSANPMCSPQGGKVWDAENDRCCDPNTETCPDVELPVNLASPLAVSDRVMSKGMTFIASLEPPEPEPDDVLCNFLESEDEDVKLRSGMMEAWVKGKAGASLEVGCRNAHTVNFTVNGMTPAEWTASEGLYVRVRNVTTNGNSYTLVQQDDTTFPLQAGRYLVGEGDAFTVTTQTVGALACEIDNPPPATMPVGGLGTAINISCQVAHPLSFNVTGLDPSDNLSLIATDSSNTSVSILLNGNMRVADTVRMLAPGDWTLTFNDACDDGVCRPVTPCPGGVCKECGFEPTGFDNQVDLTLAAAESVDITCREGRASFEVSGQLLGQLPDSDVTLNVQVGTPCRSIGSCQLYTGTTFGEACGLDDDNCYEVTTHSATVPLTPDNSASSIDFGAGATNDWAAPWIAYEGDVYVATAVTSDATRVCQFQPNYGALVQNMALIVTCVEDQGDPEATYTVSGTVIGLGRDLVVRLNNQQAVFVNVSQTDCGDPCTFVFPSEFLKYSDYDVSVSVHPKKADESFVQRCVVANGSGTVMGPVNDIVVSCDEASYITGTLANFYNGNNLSIRVTWEQAGEFSQSLDLTGNGSFTFPEPAAPEQDSSGNRHVCMNIKQYPTNPDQICCIHDSGADFAGMYVGSLWSMGYDLDAIAKFLCVISGQEVFESETNLGTCSYAMNYLSCSAAPTAGVCKDPSDSSFVVTCDSAVCVGQLAMHNLGKPWCYP